MKKKDEGTVHKLFAMFLLLWTVMGCGALMVLFQAGYVNRYLEDCITQANLAALLIEPYHYGTTGELVFEDVFSDILEQGLGAESTRKALGINGEIDVLDFRVYEVTGKGITEFVFFNDCDYKQTFYEANHKVEAPDGTSIQSSSIYAQIRIPIKLWMAEDVSVIKEHCVDIVNGEVIYE